MLAMQMVMSAGVVSRECLATAVNQGAYSFPKGGSQYSMLAKLLIFFLKSEMQTYRGCDFPTLRF